jgi:type I restriction enzyme S subunit
MSRDSTATRLKYLAAERIRNGVGEKAEFDDPDWPRYIRTTDIAGPRSLRSDTFVSLPPAIAALAPVARSDILMSAAGTVGRTYLHESGEPACYAGYLVRFRPGPAVDPRYISYWTETPLFLDQVNVGAVRSTIDNFSAGKYQNLRLTVPALEEQRAIADFLDLETQRIDIALELRRRTIELLDEKFGAVLDAAFASKVARQTRLKHLLAQSPCYGVLVPNFVDVGVPFVRVGDLVSMPPDEVPDRYIAEGQAREYARTRLEQGDILLSVVGSIDKVRVVSLALAGSNIARAVCRLVPRSGVPSDLLALWLRTSAYLRQAQRATSSDTAQPTLGMGDLADFEVWFPEPSAREAFTTRLQQRLRGLSAARICLQRQIDLMTERRQALITAAVTGQLRVSGAAA